MIELENLDLNSFYKNKRVLVTGHTGFKGGWLLAILNSLGAKVCGYSLGSPTQPSVYNLIDGDSLCLPNTGDVRDLAGLKKVFDDFEPEIVMHLAAQPLVLEGYKNPVYTFETNVMGTVNVLECIRLTPSVKSFLNVTTDKAYKNNEWPWGYRENDELCGLDPYSNSKSCSELATYSYKNAFFAGKDIALSTARAGNVIGGGDFAADRIIPDCIRSAIKNEDIFVRNPYSVRPYQHVLEPLFAYLKICMAQYKDTSYADNYNIGPDESDCASTGNLVQIFCDKWGGIKWTTVPAKNAPHEAAFLKLDSSKIRRRFNIKPVWRLNKAIEMTVEWTKALINNKDMKKETERQIALFREGGGF